MTGAKLKSNKNFKLDILLVYRIIAVAGTIIMTVGHLLSLYELLFLHKQYFLPDDSLLRIIWKCFCLLIDLLCWGSFIYLIFKPKKIVYFADISFLYAFTILIDTPSSFMGPLMYMLGISALYSRGFFVRHTKLKVCIFILAYVLLSLSQLRLGLVTFLKGMHNTSGYIIVMSLAFALLNNRQNDLIQIAGEKALNLMEVKSLSERERAILKNVLEGKKYDTIALEMKLNPTYLRTIMKEILTKVNVGNQIELLKNYGGYPIIATQEELDAWNKRITDNIPPFIEIDPFVHIPLPYIPTEDEKLLDEMEHSDIF